MLPPGFKDRVDPYLEPVDMVSGPGPMTDGDQAVWQYVLSHRQVSEREVRKALGPKGEAAAARLVRRGLLRRGWRLPRPRTAPKYSSFHPSLPGRRWEPADAGGGGPEVAAAVGPA